MPRFMTARKTVGTTTNVTRNPLIERITSSRAKWDKKINEGGEEKRLNAIERALQFNSIDALKALAKAALNKNSEDANYAAKAVEKIVKVHPTHPEILEIASMLLRIAQKEKKQRFNALYCYDSIVFASTLVSEDGSKFKQHVPALLKLLKEENANWIDFVVYCLGRIGDKRAIVPLQKLFDKTEDVTLKCQIEEALEKLNRKRMG
ncbi:MAG: HEAT repeat domain-containing protein [Candidatus Micrarchaeota archaeon]|nr:HEAT repeat domain-containing protein [Candidatus Micrarchaeota archaeon]